MDTKVLLSHRKIDHQKPPPVHALVSLRPNAVAEDARQPIDVLLSIDVSGSMDEAATGRPGGPTKIALAKQAARSFVEQLRPGDRVGLVTFEDAVQVVCPLRELTEENRRELVAAISRLHGRGSTNLAGGAIRALQLMTELPEEAGHTRRVILFTDGLPTIGVTRLADVVTNVCSISGTKMPITTMGFGGAVVANGASGGGYDPELLTALAKQTGGNFYHTEGADGILGAFAAELGALRSAAATDVRLEIVPGKGVEVVEVLNDMTVQTLQGTTLVEVGNLYSGEVGHVVIELRLPARDKTFPRDTLAATVRVSGVETSGGPFTVTQNAEFRYVKVSEADQKSDPAVDEQRVRLMAARAVEQAYAQAARGDHLGARRAVAAVAAAAAAVGTHESDELSGVLGLMSVDVGDAKNFAAKGRQVRASVMGIRTRRATGDEYTASYATDAQKRAARDMRNAPTPTPPPPAPVLPKGPGLVDRLLGRKRQEIAPQPAPPKPANPDKRRSRPF